MNPPSLSRRVVFTACMLASAGLLINALPHLVMFASMIMTVGIIAVFPRPIEEQGKVGPMPTFAKWQFICLMVLWIAEIIYSTNLYFDSANGVLVSRLALVASLVAIFFVTVQSWWHWLLIERPSERAR